MLTERNRWQKLFENVSGRVNTLAVDLYHVMQMRTCRQSTAPNQPHNIATFHSLTFFHQRLSEVPVEGLDSIPMIDAHDIPQFGVEPNRRDTALSRSLHRRIGGSPNIKPVVPSRLFCEWRDTRAKPRGDPPLDRPDRRSGCPAGGTLLRSFGQLLKNFFLNRRFLR